MGKNTTLTVLIVDDSIMVRDRLRTIISELNDGILVGQASNGTEALETIAYLKPDVVILDIRMPQGSGIEILEKLKADQDPSLVIMLTAYAYPQYRQKCLAAGADYFFDKATEFERVAEVLKREAAELSADESASEQSNQNLE